MYTKCDPILLDEKAFFLILWCTLNIGRQFSVSTQTSKPSMYPLCIDKCKTVYTIEWEGFDDGNRSYEP